MLRGRDSELGELDRLIAGGLSGSAAVVLVEGPAGIGKSALLQAGRELGAAREMSVAAGRADELDQISPWSTLIQAFSSTQPPILDDTALQSTPGRLDQRGAILDAFRDSLESAAMRRPLLVLLDDLQWADQATIAALGWLPEQLFSYPIVWLLAHRPLPRSAPLEALVIRLKGSGARHWHLTPLDDVATLELAHDIAGPEIGRSTQQLLRTAGGNPLFIIEVIRLQHQGGNSPRRFDTPRVTFPPSGTDSLRAIVETHVRSLSDPTVEFLKVASVLGQEFATSEASQLSGRPSAQLLPAIEESMIAGVLVDAGQQVAFRHDVFRQVLYASIPGALRRSLHAEAAVVLRRNGASATRLAHQLLIGAEAGNPEAVASLYEAVGELVGTSPWAAADLAVRLTDLMPLGSAERATAVSMAVQLLGWAGRSDDARSLGESFLDSSSVDVVTEAEILLGIRRAWVSRHTLPYPRPLPQRVLEDPRVPPPVRANLLTFEQVGPLSQGDRAQADDKLNEAAALLTGSGTDLDAAGVVPLWVVSAQLRGQFEVAAERAGRDLHLSPSGDGTAGVSITNCAVAQCLAGLGQIQEGLATIEEAIRAGEASGYPLSWTQYRCVRAALLLDAGRLDDAQAEASVAAEATFDAGFLSIARLAFTTLVESSVRVGDLAGADRALARLRECEGEAINPDEHWAMAFVAQARGRGPAAMQALGPVFAALAEGYFAIASRHPGRLPQLVSLALHEGKEEAAMVAVSAAAHLASANDGVPLLDQVALHAHGLLRRDRILLRRAYELSQSSEVRLAHAIVAEDLGALEEASGRRSEAVSALEEAFDTYTKMGAELDVARVRAKLRKVGVRKRHAAAGRPDRGWASLTPAELAVVRVVAKGLTNRAAAEELSLSPDTVNTHLRHVFTKLDISSRAELARLVAAKTVELEGTIPPSQASHPSG